MEVEPQLSHLLECFAAQEFIILYFGHLWLQWSLTGGDTGSEQYHYDFHFSNEYPQA